VRPLLVLRVGYMERYDGPDTITSGGAYIQANGVGGEVFNFKPSRGKCYGYAMSLHFSGINLGVLDKSRRWQQGEELSNVDVVFIARRPGHGQVVIGWYRNATVFHRQYRLRRGRIAGIDEATRPFLCVTDKASAVLLPEADRAFPVPYAPAGHPGFPGQSNVWYPAHHLTNRVVARFTLDLLKYMNAVRAPTHLSDEVDQRGKGRKGGRRPTPDAGHNAAVETAAEETAWSYYKQKGYKVDDVADERLGWDFVARKGAVTLHVEVKGVSAAAIYFELTPNEYAKLQQYADRYRVCVVCDALTVPRLYELLPEPWAGGWRLASKLPPVHVPLTQKIAAVGCEVAMDLEKP